MDCDKRELTSVKCLFISLCLPYAGLLQDLGYLPKKYVKIEIVIFCSLVGICV